MLLYTGVADVWARRGAAALIWRKQQSHKLTTSQGSNTVHQSQAETMTSEANQKNHNSVTQKGTLRPEVVTELELVFHTAQHKINSLI